MRVHMWTSRPLSYWAGDAIAPSAGLLQHANMIGTVITLAPRSTPSLGRLTHKANQ